MRRGVVLFLALLGACAPERRPLAWRSCDAGAPCLVGVVGDGGAGGIVFCETSDAGQTRPVCVLP